MNQDRDEMILQGMGSLDYLSDATKYVLRKMRELLGSDREKQKQRGGYLCIADRNTGVPYTTTIVGPLPHIDRADRLDTLAREQARWLARHPGVRSSWEIRDPIFWTVLLPGGRCGGAVVADERYITSFAGAGFLELENETVALGVTCLAFDMSREEARSIAALSGNSYFLLLEPHLDEDEV